MDHLRLFFFFAETSAIEPGNQVVGNPIVKPEVLAGGGSRQFLPQLCGRGYGSLGMQKGFMLALVDKFRQFDADAAVGFLAGRVVGRMMGDRFNKDVRGVGRVRTNCALRESGNTRLSPACYLYFAAAPVVVSRLSRGSIQAIFFLECVECTEEIVGAKWYRVGTGGSEIETDTVYDDAVMVCTAAQFGWKLAAEGVLRHYPTRHVSVGARRFRYDDNFRTVIRYGDGTRAVDE